MKEASIPVKVLKCWPEYFSDIVSGAKKFDVRLGDFKVEMYDLIMFVEFDPKTQSLTGKKVPKRAGHVMRLSIMDDCVLDFWSREEIARHGLQIISLDPCEIDAGWVPIPAS